MAESFAAQVIKGAIVALLRMELGIFLLMSVKFTSMVPVFLTFVPFTWLRLQAQRRLRT